jgi:hypothetical protein
MSEAQPTVGAVKSILRAQGTVLEGAAQQEQQVRAQLTEHEQEARGIHDELGKLATRLGALQGNVTTTNENHGTATKAVADAVEVINRTGDGSDPLQGDVVRQLGAAQESMTESGTVLTGVVGAVEGDAKLLQGLDQELQKVVGGLATTGESVEGLGQHIEGGIKSLNDWIHIA